MIEQRKHELTVTLPPDPIWLRADATRIEKVVVNLLNNAAKYTDEGGHIWLTAEQERDCALLRVRDTGVGIAPELISHIFDLFTQGNRHWNARRRLRRWIDVGSKNRRATPGKR